MQHQLALSEIFRYSKALSDNLDTKLDDHVDSSSKLSIDQCLEISIDDGIIAKHEHLADFIKIEQQAHKIILTLVKPIVQIIKIKHNGTISRPLFFEISVSCQIIEEVATAQAQIETIFNIHDNVDFSHNLLNAGQNWANRYLSQVIINNHARYTNNILNLQCHKLQVILHIELNGINAHCDNHILNYARKNNNLDTLLLIAHNNSHSTSHTTSHAIAEDQATTSMLGKIYVKDNVKQVTGDLQIKNLLCSAQATCNSRPQLEIYSDDVKCSHGATTGSLSKEALYYMQSRGIDHELAKKLLLAAFIKKIMQNISILELKEHVYQLLNLSDE